jgi:hypothetical protein
MKRGPRHSAGGFKTRSDSNQLQTNSNPIQFVSNFDRPKRDLPKIKFFLKNMVVKVLENRTTFSIGLSSDPKWILN